MSVPTNISFKDFVKAVKILALRDFERCEVDTSKRGSQISFMLFRKDVDVPVAMWAAHEDLREKKVYTLDLKKACDNLNVTKKDFEVLIRNKFKEKPSK